MEKLKTQTKAYLFFRAIVEKIFSACVILLLSPVFLILALVILMTMGRPVFFTQERMGKNKRPFKIYKFRTMHNHDKPLAYASKNDPRITPLGQTIRQHRLDELPQFFNVLLGSMSVIGPRPEPVTFAEQYSQTIANYDRRHLVNPGITGFAQVSMGYADSEDTTRDKVAYDLEYVQKLSFLMDLKIVFKTIKIMLSGFGAR